MRFAIYLLLILVAIQGLTRGADVWLENGRPLPDATYAKSTNGFAARLQVLPDKKLIEDWYKPTPPVIRDVERVSRGKTNYIVILFAGAGQKQDGVSEIVYDIDLVSPSGTVKQLAANVVGWKDFAITSPQKMQMGFTHVHISFEATNLAGVYILKAAVRDKVKGLALGLSREIRLED